ncbi:MAG: DUF2079 domain-containing protein [bacterium]|nr:DUF2079 domain-containing protein [bacterium]
MRDFFTKNKYGVILSLLILAYIVYFSYFTILRLHTLGASYFDLGIMHQTVFNTYKAIVEHDPSRILELTNPFNSDQIKRMAIHNDVLLAVLAIFYFIHSGPETLLVIQAVMLGLGALAVYGIANHVFQSQSRKRLIGLVFALAYLLYTPMERANIFDFHVVTLSTATLLCMWYFWIKKKYVISFIFLVLSLFSKEQVGLTTFFFGLYIAYRYLQATKINPHMSEKKELVFAYLVMLISVGWFLLSMAIIIPYFRGGKHFALDYYGDFGDSSLGVGTVIKHLFHIDTARYFWFLLGPLAFFSLFAPLQLLIAAPEFGINLLSNNWNMRNIIYHYTSVIQPFVFISAIYGMHNLHIFLTHTKKKRPLIILSVILLIFSGMFSFFKGPLPYSQEKELHPFLYPQPEAKDARFWANTLSDENLKISTTGKLAPLFTSRRYFYTFSSHYPLADYIVLRLNEVYTFPEKKSLIPVYEKLSKDPNYTMIYKKNRLEVYKKIVKS